MSERRNTEADGPPPATPGGAAGDRDGPHSVPPAPGAAGPEVSPELVARVAAGELPPESLLRAALAHLRRRCRGCRKTGATLAAALRGRGGRFGDDDLLYAAAHAGLADPDRLLAGERRRAARELARLATLSHEERLACARRGSTRYRRPALVDAAIAEGRSRMPAHPRAALEWFDLACALALRLYRAGHADGVIAERALRAAAHRANALRVAGDLPAAAEAFSRLAADPRRSLVADPAVHGELASLEASLRFDQRRLEEAAALAAEAVELYRESGDRAGEGRALIQLGNANLRSSKLDQAVECFRRAAHRFDPEIDLRDHLHAVNNLALALCSAGDFAAAGDLVAENRHLFARDMDAWSRPRLAGLEARIARGLGDPEAAERHFRGALDGYLAVGNAFNTTLAALDLAELYLEQGRTAEVRALAETTGTALAALDVPAEVARAARLFAQAATAERLTGALLARFRRGLRI